MSDWISVQDELPKNERVEAFTPTSDESMRNRFIPAGLFSQVASDATHWRPVSSPLDVKLES